MHVVYFSLIAKLANDARELVFADCLDDVVFNCAQYPRHRLIIPRAQTCAAPGIVTRMRGNRSAGSVARSAIEPGAR